MAARAQGNTASTAGGGQDAEQVEQEVEERHLEDGDEEEATTTESGSAAGTGSRRATGTDDEEDDDDDYGAVNPTRDALQEGILGLLRPTVEAIESRVSDTRAAQEELRDHISALQEDLDAIATKSEAQKAGIDLEAAVEKLNNAKRRVVVVANLLQGAQDRLNKVHQGCLKETARRRAQLESGQASSVSSPSSSSSSATIGVSSVPVAQPQSSSSGRR